MKTARQAAFEALLKIQREGAYSNLVVDAALKDNEHFDERDKAFFSNLVYGTLDRLILIDYNLGLYLNQPVRKLKPELHTILSSVHISFSFLIRYRHVRLSMKALTLQR